MTDIDKTTRDADEAMASYVQDWFDGKKDGSSDFDLDEAILDAIQAVSHGRDVDGDIEDSYERARDLHFDGPMRRSERSAVGPRPRVVDARWDALAERARTYLELKPADVVRLLGERGFPVDTHGIVV